VIGELVQHEDSRDGVLRAVQEAEALIEAAIADLEGKSAQSGQRDPDTEFRF
jgi:hypothetical protein